MAASLAPALAIAGPAAADEPLFGFVNTTDLLPKGKMQVEAWLSLRDGGALGEYRTIEGRAEFDYGLTSAVQTTLYLNFSDLDARVDPAAAAALRVSPSGRLERSRIDGVTGEVIWRIASPYLDPIGLALLADASIGPDHDVLGLKAIAQKNFRDDTVVLASNLRVDIGQRERRHPNGGGPPRPEGVTAFEASAGVSYRFRANWSVALEARARGKSADGLFGHLEDTAVFLGPTLHYGGQRWFATLSAFKRVTAADAPDPALADSLAYARDRVRWDAVRLRVGRTF